MYVATRTTDNPEGTATPIVTSVDMDFCIVPIQLDNLEDKVPHQMYHACTCKLHDIYTGRLGVLHK